MRTAILSDIHGNLLALEAVLADIPEPETIDSYWVLGDLVAMGPDPRGVARPMRASPTCKQSGQHGPLAMRCSAGIPAHSRRNQPRGRKE
ncbi:MAG: metallophosphoesterase [Caldilineaceae bacterium]